MVRLLLLLCLLVPLSAFSQGSVRFTEGDSALDIPFQRNSDKMYVMVRLNGDGPFWMVLDTGSPVMVLDTRTVERLGLELGDSFDTGGAGEGAFTLSQVTTPVQAQVRGLVLEGQDALAGDLDGVVGPFEGRRIDGLLGGGNVLSTQIVVVDYGKNRLHVYAPDAFVEPTAAELVDLSIRDGHAFTRGTITAPLGEPVDGEFLIDTGLRGTLILHTPFVDEHGFLDRCGPTVEATVGGGIGGEARAVVGRLRKLAFGNVVVPGIHVSLSQATSGLLATDYASGIIGSAVLQRYRVTFDYGESRMLLEPRTVDPDLLDYDKSGMFLIAPDEDRKEFTVIDVVPHGPADRAGLLVGDVITEYAGKSALELHLEQIRRSFRSPEGTEFPMTVTRNGEPHQVVLVLGRLL